MKTKSITSDTEYYIIFASVIFRIIFNAYAMRITNFHDRDFFVITFLIAIPLFIFSLFIKFNAYHFGIIYAVLASWRKLSLMSLPGYPPFPLQMK